MSKIPTGEFNAESIALELYDKDGFRSAAFDEAYKHFFDGSLKDSFETNPDRFHETVENAAEFILNRFSDEYSDLYSEAEWQKICDFLYEHIYAGLT